MSACLCPFTFIVAVDRYECVKTKCLNITTDIANGCYTINKFTIYTTPSHTPTNSMHVISIKVYTLAPLNFKNVPSVHLGIIMISLLFTSFLHFFFFFARKSPSNVQVHNNCWRVAKTYSWLYSFRIRSKQQSHFNIFSVRFYFFVFSLCLCRISLFFAQSITLQLSSWFMCVCCEYAYNNIDDSTNKPHSECTEYIVKSTQSRWNHVVRSFLPFSSLLFGQHQISNILAYDTARQSRTKRNSTAITVVEAVCM